MEQRRIDFIKETLRDPDCTEKIQLFTVMKNGDLLRLIGNPTERVMIEAVKNNVKAISHISLKRFESLSKETRDVLTNLIKDW